VAGLILLDRDGVINRDSDAFVKSADEFVPLPGAYDAIARLCRAGFLIAVCTNQSGIGRGLLSEAELAAIHRKMLRGITEAGGTVHGLRHCPHLPEDGCSCRKPQPGMVFGLMAELDCSSTATTFVGDSVRDLQAGRAAGCRVVLVRTGNGANSEAKARAIGCEEVYDDLASFAKAELSRLEAMSGVQQ
jgi:D-glycero-D-manno-heptose 1,7-bisphosphate phosphatase